MINLSSSRRKSLIKMRLKVQTFKPAKYVLERTFKKGLPVGTCACVCVCVEVLLKAAIYKGWLVNYIMLNHPAAREPAVLWCQSLSGSLMQCLLNQTWRLISRVTFQRKMIQNCFVQKCPKPRNI